MHPALRTTLKWTLRVLGGLAGLVVIAISVAAIFLHTGCGREIIRKKAEAALAGAFPGSKIGSIEAGLLGSVSVKGLVIAGENQATLVKVDSIEVDVSLLPLLGKTVHVDRIAVAGVEYAAGVKPPAKPPEPEPTPPAEPSSGPGWTIELPDVEVRGVKMTGDKRAEEVTGVDVDAAVNLDGGTLDAQVRVSGAWRGKPFVVLAGARKAGDVIEAPLVTARIGGESGEWLSVLGARYDGELIAGHISGRASAASVKEVAGLELADEVGLAIDARSDGNLELRAASGGAHVHGMFTLDVPQQRAKGVLIAEAPDVAAIAKGLPPGSGIAIASIEADRGGVRGMISARGGRDGHHATTLLAIDATPQNAWLGMQAVSDFGGTHASVLAQVVKKGDAYQISNGTLTARAGRVDVAATPRARASAGSTEAQFNLSGRLWPDPEVRVAGGVSARGLAFAQYSAAGADAYLEDVVATATGVKGRAQITVSQARQGAAPLASVELGLRATEVFGGKLEVDIASHKITTAANRVWSGNGGRIVVDGDQITLRDLHTGYGSGKVDAAASFDKASGDLTAKLDGKSFALASLAPDLAGTVGVTAQIARKQGRWDGTATLDGKGVVVTSDHPPVDATGTLAIHGRKLVVTASASSAPIGSVDLATELETPADPTDITGWKRSQRSAIHKLEVKFGNVKLAGASPRLTGSLDGDAELTATGAGGTVHLRGLMLKGNEVDTDVTFGPDEHGHVVAIVGAKLGELLAINGEGELALPKFPFDPVSWQTLGREALAGGELHAKDVTIDPGVLAKLGKDLPYRAKIDFDAQLATGATSLSVQLAVHELRGGALQKPIELAAAVMVDEDHAHASANVKSGEINLLDLIADSPITIDGLRTADPRTAALTGEIGLPLAAAAGTAVPPAQVKDLLSLLGRDDILAGTYSGGIELAGTLGTPTAHAVITAKDVAIRASVEGRPPAKLADLVLDARWGGAAGSLDLLAHESPNGMLHITAHGSPDQLAKLGTSIEAREFDVAPLTAFAPGPIGAARGVIDTFLTIQGIDPDTGDVHGNIHLHDARVPLAAMIGTLRAGDVRLQIQNHGITGTIAGKLGSGTLDGKIDVKLAGSTPKTADLTINLQKISLIRAHQPVINATVETHFKHGDQWTGDVTISKATVLVPSTGGRKLLASSAPGDMAFVDAPPPKAGMLQRPPPAHPWLLLDITIKPLTLDIEDDQYQVTGRASGHLALEIGDGIGADGEIEAQRGDIQLFGQRSQLDHGLVVFDGTLDPLLDIRVIRDLSTLVVTADVGGRASAPSLNFGSDQGSYSQGELLAYFVGGQPGGDGGEVGQAALQAGAGVAAQFLSKNLNQRFFDKILPIKLNLDMRLEAATSSNSEAVGFGRNLGRDTYLEFRNHPEARPDENENEGSIEYRIRHTDWRLRGEIGDRNYDSGEIEHRWHW